MRHIALRVGSLLALAGCAAATQRGPAGRTDLAITNVSVIDIVRGRTIAGQTVLVSGERILSVVPSAQARLASTVRVVDGRGRYLIPGLWDMHAHLGVTPAAPPTELPLFVAHGVTGVRVMAADRPSARPDVTPGLDLHRALQAQIAVGTLIGPRLLALASWPVDGAGNMSDAMPAFYKASTREEGRQLARYFKERGFDFIKVYNNIAREGYLGMAEEARSIGLPLAGHEPRALSAIELSNAGQKSIEHSRIFLLNCFPGADSMQRGLLRNVPPTTLRRRMVDEYDPRRCAEVFRTFARNGTYITPTHGTRRMDAFADDSAYRNDPRLTYLPLGQQLAWQADASGIVASDSSAAGRTSFMDFYRLGLTLTRDAVRAGVPFMLGTDAGDSFIFPGSGVHDELRELVSAGLSPAEALRAATLHGATYLGRTADFGSVAAGRYADLVLLDANPLDDIGNSHRIHAVVMGGRVHDRAALDAMLRGVEVAVRPSEQAKLWAASIRGDTAAIARALAGGASIDSLDPQGNRRPLNYAAINNRAAAVRLLLARGAGINLANRTGFTPLHHAVEGNAIEALTVLLAAGADLSLKNAQGATAHDMARLRGNQAALAAFEVAARRP